MTLGSSFFAAAGTCHLTRMRVDREVAEPEALLEWIFSGGVCRCVHLSPEGSG